MCPNRPLAMATCTATIAVSNPRTTAAAEGMLLRPRWVVAAAPAVAYRLRRMYHLLWQLRLLSLPSLLPVVAEVVVGVPQPQPQPQPLQRLLRLLLPTVQWTAIRKC